MTSYWDVPKGELLDIDASAFAQSMRIRTRWRDNDANGHVNNALYYEFFDSAINTWIRGQLPASDPPSFYPAFVAESGCKYLREIHYPSVLQVGWNVTYLGRSSVTYELALFPVLRDSPGPIAALGRWTHVYIDANSRKPREIPAAIRNILQATHLVEPHQVGRVLSAPPGSRRR